MFAATAMSCAQAHTGIEQTPTASEKVPGALLRSLNVGAARDVLVELVPDEVREPSSDAGSALDGGPATDAGAIGTMTEGLARDLGGLPTEVASSLIDEDLEQRAKYYEAAQDAITSDLDENEVKVLTRYEHVPFLFVKVSTLRGLYALANRPEVLRLHEDKEYEHQLADSLQLINQPAVAVTGKRGEGTAVAVLDTGADYTRPDFGSCNAPGEGCKVAFAQDFAKSDSAADDNGHGTNVAAIVLGVAPSARVLALDVFEANGLALSSAIIAAVDWSIKNRTTYNIVAMNLSLGGGSYNKLCTSNPFASALANARAAGVVPVVASGNGGLTGALAAPACVPAAVSVGAVYDANVGGLSYSNCSDRTTAANQIACFSNSASFLSMLAPGAPITAGGFRMTGTSQAAPHVAGAYAVVRSAFPGEAINASIARLTDSGSSIRDSRNGISKRRLDLQAAIKGANVRDNTAPTGSVVINGNQATTISADVTLSITGTDVNGIDSMCVSNAGTCTTTEAFATSKAWKLSGGDGLKTVRVALKDAAGNQAVVTDTIRLDTAGPTGGTLRAMPQNSAVGLSWGAASDSGSGLSGYRLAVAQGSPPASCTEGSLIYTGNSRTFTHTGLTNGTLYGYRVCPTDMAGNVGAGSTASTRPAPELQPPTGSLKINGGTSVTRSESVTLSFTATDASGVARMCISNSKTSCTTWENFSQSKTWSLATPSGSTAVFVWYEDAFGNRTINPATANILVDNAPPTGVNVKVAAGQALVNVSWNAAQDASGIAAYTLLFAPGTTPPATCSAGTKLYEGLLRTFIHQNLTPGSSYSYRLCATDRAGNLSSGAVATTTAL
jgi:subtilisin family serine protease